MIMNDNELSSKLDTCVRFCRINTSVHIEGSNLRVGIAWHKITFSVDISGFYELDLEPAVYNLASPLCAFKYTLKTRGFRS